MLNRFYDKDSIVKMYEELEYIESKEGVYLSKKKNFIKMIGNILFLSAMILFIFVFVMVQNAKTEGKTASIMGYSLNYVLTGSMEPTYPEGTILLSKDVKDKSKLVIGDVVVFYGVENRITTHRIVEVISHQGEIAYRTKGDSEFNSIDNEILTQDKIISIVKIKLW